jgi:hypothetical protein
MPNRPIYNAVEKRMGLISSCAHTMQLFGVCNTSASLRHVRQIRADGSFRFVTGGASMPISYRKSFPGTVKSVGNATVGVRSSMEFDGAATALDNAKTVAAVPVPQNEDRAPREVRERRPGTFFTLEPRARAICQLVAERLDDAQMTFLLTSPPRTNETAWAIRSRDPQTGRTIFAPGDRTFVARVAREHGYLLIVLNDQYRFEPRRPNQPDYVVRHG